MLCLDAPEYFIKLKEMKDKEPKVGGKFEPTEKGYTKARLEHLYSTNLAVSTWWTIFEPSYLIYHLRSWQFIDSYPCKLFL